MGFWHNLYIRRLPGPSPRFLLFVYRYLPWKLQCSEGKTYQKPTRKKTGKYITSNKITQILESKRFQLSSTDLGMRDLIFRTKLSNSGVSR